MSLSLRVVATLVCHVGGVSYWSIKLDLYETFDGDS